MRTLSTALSHVKQRLLKTGLFNCDVIKTKRNRFPPVRLKVPLTVRNRLHAARLQGRRPYVGIHLTQSHRRVWRRQGERFDDRNFIERDRFYGGSVMVWGGIRHRAKTKLVNITGTYGGIEVTWNISFYLARTRAITFSRDRQKKWYIFFLFRVHDMASGVKYMFL